MSKARQRGYVMVVALLLGAALGIMGVILINSMMSDAKLMGAERSTLEAQQLAEMGIGWAYDFINRKIEIDQSEILHEGLNGYTNYTPLLKFRPAADYGYGYIDSNSSGGVSGSRTKVLATNDDVCAVNAIYRAQGGACYPKEFLATSSSRQWRRLHKDEKRVLVRNSENAMKGSYRVAIRDDDDGDGNYDLDTNQSILVRSYGVSLGGARKLLEVRFSWGCDRF